MLNMLIQFGNAIARFFTAGFAGCCHANQPDDHETQNPNSWQRPSAPPPSPIEQKKTYGAPINVNVVVNNKESPNIIRNEHHNHLHLENGLSSRNSTEDACAAAFADREEIPKYTHSYLRGKTPRMPIEYKGMGQIKDKSVLGNHRLEDWADRGDDESTPQGHPPEKRQGMLFD